jgi:hypothetical protein
MSVTIGKYNEGPNVWYPSATSNQQGSIFTIPSAGTISRLGAWLGPFSLSVPTQLCIWDATTGALLGHSVSFNLTVGNWYRYEYDLGSPVTVAAGQTVIIGVWWHIDGSNDTITSRIESSGLAYFKNNVGSGGPTSFASHDGTVANTMDVYAYLAPFTKPDKPTTEAYGVVTSVTPTIRLYVHTPDGSPVTSLSFVVTGVSPAHGPATKTLTGSFASGTWQSYTLAPADLGWTPAAGDTLTYHGIATNSGGSTTGDESSVMTINSTQAPTITSPIAGPVIATPVFTGGTTPLVGCSVGWTFNDAQGEAQSAYQVKLYADSGGAKGSLLTGADTGKVTSIAGRSANVTPTAGLTNKAYFWVGVTTWDVHDAASTEATVRTRMAWGRSDGRYDLGATPTQWALDHVSATVPANSQVVIEYTSTTGGTGQTGWNQDFSTVTMRRWFHWRLWLFGWGSASPTSPSLDEIALQFTAASNVVPDNWDLTQAGGKAALDVSTYRYGSQALRITCAGNSTTPYARQQIPVRPYTAYVISAFIKALKLGGTFEAWVDLFDGANSLVASSKITATTSDFGQVVSVPYTTGAETSLWFRLMVTDGAGSAGSVAWFDAVEAQASTVVTAWQPGGVGRAVALDSGGMSVDGSAGGVARFHGTGSGANDYAELGVHGWKYGGGPELGSPDGIALSTYGAALATGAMTAASVAATGAVSAGGINVLPIDGGNAFPTGAALTAYGDYRPYIRTDRGGQAYQHEGAAGWLSTSIFEINAWANAVSALSATNSDWLRAPVPDYRGGTGIWLVEFNVAGLNIATGGTALGASHKWDVQAQTCDTSATFAALGSAVSINTGTNGWHKGTEYNGPTAIGAAVGSTIVFLDIKATKTGTPGNFVGYPTLTYRIIG